MTITIATIPPPDARLRPTWTVKTAAGHLRDQELFSTASRRFTLASSAQPPDTNTPTHASTISETIREHELLQQRLRDEVALLGNEHTDQWVGMGPDLVIVFADTLDELVRNLKPSKNDDRTVVVRYLSSDPPVLVL